MVTLADIAALAQVRRPSVSNWRRRHADFPAPVAGTPALPLFDADAVALWLDRRPAPGVGARPGESTATYGDIFRDGLRRRGPASGASADGDMLVDVGLELVALRAGYGQPLSTEHGALERISTQVEQAYPVLTGLFDGLPANRALVATLLPDVNRLVALAKEVSDDRGKAAEMGLTEDEYAFYTAVAQNQSAKEILGDAVLGQIARDLVKELQDLPVDWWIREQAQALVRSRVKRLLARYGYPPDARPEAVELVLRQTRTYVEDQV